MEELRAEKTPLLYDVEASRSQIDGNSVSNTRETSSSNCKDVDWRAPSIILGFACLESLGFYGISTNLVIYLINVFHKSNLSAATSYTNWAGTSFFTPFLGALIADSYLGNYRMILYSSSIYFLGMVVITLSASIPSLKPGPCTGNICPPATITQNLIFYSGLYLIAFGSGGVKSSLLPLGASQFDDKNPVQLEKRGTFINWIYFCANVGGIFSGTLIVWLQENISWSIGYSIATLCLALAIASFLYGTPKFQIQEPRGSPLSLQYTNNSRLIDKDANAFISDTMEESSRSPTTERTGTIETDIKKFIRLIPIWVTGIFYSVAYAQVETTFIEQGKSMHTKIKSFSIPPASFTAFEIVSFMFWACLYDAIIPLALKKLSLLRMGIGHLFMISAMVIAAVMESKRLKNPNMHILWQIPQYFMVAASEGLYYVGQLEFFYDQGPGSMKSLSTSMSLLTLALGGYLSSVVVMIVSFATSGGGEEGWIPHDLDEGHLDYFFWLLAAICVVNFVCYVAFAWRYTLKKLTSEC